MRNAYILICIFMNGRTGGQRHGSICRPTKARKHWTARLGRQGSEMEQKDRIKNIRNSTGMNRRNFCEYFQIPYSTMTDWERGVRHAPEYVLRLLEYHVRFIGAKENAPENEGEVRPDAEMKGSAAANTEGKGHDEEDDEEKGERMARG